MIRTSLHFLTSALLAMLVTTYGLTATVAAEEPPIVAAASDLQFALREAAREFTTATGRNVRLNFGSSGHFRHQIARGAPFELFLSANEAYVQALVDEDHTRGSGVLYAIGRIAIIAPASNAAIADASLTELKRRLTSGKFGRFAIANPEHAPYGVAAREALHSIGLWKTIRPHLILGENVSQAMQFALSGETEGGIVAYSLALAPPVRERARHALIPQEQHAPLRQRMVLLRNAGETATMFYHYLQQAETRRIFNRHGFMLPGDELQQDNPAWTGLH